MRRNADESIQTDEAFGCAAHGVYNGRISRYRILASAEQEVKQGRQSRGLWRPRNTPTIRRKLAGPTKFRGHMNWARYGSQVETPGPR